MKVRTLVVTLGAAFCAAGCSKSDTAASAQAASAPAGAPMAAPVVAEIHGQAVSAAELDERARQRLMPILQQQYDVRREVLDEIISERLFQAEAQARGITVDALLKAEVFDKVATPDAAQARQLYDQHKDRVGGRSFEELRPQIDAMLREQALGERRQAFRKALATKAGVRRMLAPPRAEIRVPERALGDGPDSARVTIVTYSDYQCPFCRRAQITIDEILQRYPKDVRVVVREFPLDIHPRARMAAKAARCAGEQGRFWPYYRHLMMVSGDLGDADLKSRAASTGLPAETFATCLASARYDSDVQEAYQEGVRLGVSSTPTFFVNGRMLLGAQPVERFVEVIDEELAG